MTRVPPSAAAEEDEGDVVVRGVTEQPLGEQLAQLRRSEVPPLDERVGGAADALVQGLVTPLDKAVGVEQEGRAGGQGQLRIGPLVPAKRLQELEPVHQRHGQVEQHEVRIEVEKALQRRRRVGTGDRDARGR